MNLFGLFEKKKKVISAKFVSLYLSLGFLKNRYIEL